ncbi:tetratricopeptide repeat protein [Skeletonema marinoi]|uniref:Tetratricopeptide repeat protein n=1 Tax=Skeletonema marinoi TaxID=267567 RepID=A0AAD8Y2U6_9STRA|nr:tetratricopeptide repeat protein [Skeletonema marinoi]
MKLNQKVDVTTEMLDYAYIEQCNDVSALRAIYEKLLRNDHGKYPDLEYAAKIRLSTLLPKKEQGKVGTEVSVEAAAMASQEEVGREKIALHSWIDNNAKSNAESTSHFQEKNELSCPPVRQPQLVAPRMNDSVEASQKQSDIVKVDSSSVKAEGKDELSQLQERMDNNDFTLAERKFMSEREKEKGNELFKVGQIDESIQCYTKSILLDATNAKSFANRALAKMKCNPPDFEGAVDDCTAALKIDPNYIKAYVRRGTLLDTLGQFDAAVKDFEAANKLDADGGCNRLAQSSRERLLKPREKMLHQSSLQIVEVDGIGEDELVSEDGFDYMEEIYTPGAVESMMPKQADKAYAPKSTSGFATNLKKFFSSKTDKSSAGGSCSDAFTDNWCRVDIVTDEDGGDSEESDTTTAMQKIDIVEKNVSPSASNKRLTNHDSQTLCF